MMDLRHSVAIAFYLLSSGNLLLFYRTAGLSQSALCVDQFHSVVSATSAPISVRKTNKLHFFSGDCSDPEVQRQIKEQFIQLLNASFFKEVCQADTLRDKCKADNVKVTCYVETRRRRSLSSEFKEYHYCDVLHCPVMERLTIIINFMEYSNFNKAAPIFLPRFPSLKM